MSQFRRLMNSPFRRILIAGFVIATYAKWSIYIFEPNHVDITKLHWSLQWLILWVLATGLISCINRIGRK